ncbi:MAG: T9SS type A sorting domain-containing protein [Flavobacteriales bacterium]|nr:T9SS type A sorting domain-containing protein [Flavobacteriales bacterium]
MFPKSLNLETTIFTFFFIFSLSITAQTLCNGIAQVKKDSLYVIEGQSMDIGLAPVAGISYDWSPNKDLDNNNKANPKANPVETIEYKLTATALATKSTTTTIDISELPAGVYLVAVTQTDKTVFQQKIVIRR